MIDTIHCYHYTDSSLIKTIAPLLTSAKSKRINNEVPFVNGNLDNLKIGISHDRISLKGSLSKYHLGSNLKQFTRNDIKLCIEQLSDTLCTDIGNAKISRQDKGINLIMDQTPIAYYDVLVESSRLSRFRQKNSLYFSNGARQNIFYDKIKEMKGKGIPNHMIDKYVLRFETRSLTPTVQFKQIVRLRNLYDEGFYKMLLDDTLKQYNSIIKAPKMAISKDWMTTPKDMNTYLALIGLQSLGLDQAIKVIEELRASNQLDKPQYYSAAKNNTKKLLEMLNDGITDLQKELDQKVNNAIRNHR